MNFFLSSLFLHEGSVTKLTKKSIMSQLLCSCVGINAEELGVPPASPSNNNNMQCQ